MNRFEMSKSIAELIESAIEVHSDWVDVRQADWKTDTKHGRMDRKFRIALKQLQEAADDNGFVPPCFDLNLPEQVGYWQSIKTPETRK